MQETTKHVHLAYVALGRAIQSAKGKSLERTIQPLWLAFDIVKDIREYSLMGDKR
jgi:hypothetical protein